MDHVAAVRHSVSVEVLDLAVLDRTVLEPAVLDRTASVVAMLVHMAKAVAQHMD